MKPELWQRITDLFDEAMSGGQKSASRFSRKPVEGDKDLRQQVESADRLGRKIG